jgi:signal transduction histidine kinase
VVTVGPRWHRRKDGSLIEVEMISLALQFAGREARLIVGRDVTAERQAEQERQRLRAEVERAEKMAVMGALVAGVAHEVRNPLFSISATLDALESELGEDAAYAPYANLLRSQVARLTQLMRDLLDYGKPSVLRRGPTRLSDVVRRAIRSCAPLAREHEVRVQEDVARELPALDIDGPRVEQAMENLVANAIQHAPAGSVVRVEAGLEARNPAELARCSVEDEGPGLPPDALERVFEPFFTRRKGGTGLGLSIVQRVAEAHGGTVVAENRPGGGARFTLLLPVGAATPEPGSDA